VNLQEADVAETRESGSWKLRLREARIGGKMGVGEECGRAGSRMPVPLCYPETTTPKYSDRHDRNMRQHDCMRKNCLQRMTLTTLFEIDFGGEEPIRRE